jgi:arabinose-5-phosphate isomerase
MKQNFQSEKLTPEEPNIKEFDLIKQINHFKNALHKQALLSENLEQKKNFDKLSHAVSECDTEIKGTKQIVFCAVGKSACVGQLVTSMFHSVGIRARFLHPTEALHGDLGLVQNNDVVIYISNGGRTSEIIQIAPFIAKRTQEIFSLTSQKDSPIAKLSPTVCLIPQVNEGCPLGQAPLTSTILTLSYCQALVAASLENRKIELQRYAQNHPGGAIGKRIFVKVSDVMIPLQNLLTCNKNTKFSDCISILTKSGTSGICVVNHEYVLEGLIAEKDVRNSMEKFGKNVFDKIAQEIMNTNPTCLAPDTLAQEALSNMETNERVLNIAPVVTKNKNLLGLVKLLDLKKETLS